MDQIECVLCGGFCKGKCQRLITEGMPCGRCGREYGAHSHEGDAVFCPVDLTFIPAEDNVAVEVRPVLADFVLEMEKQLQAHDAERGERGWLTDGETVDLADRLSYKLNDLTRAIADGEPTFEALKYAADIANFAMMIADIYVDRQVTAEIENSDRQEEVFDPALERAEKFLNDHFCGKESAEMDATDLAVLIREVKAEDGEDEGEGLAPCTCEECSDPCDTGCPDYATETVTTTTPVLPTDDATTVTATVHGPRPLLRWMQSHTTTTMTDCPTCDGTGTKTYVDRLLPDDVTPLPRTTRCKTCDGTGQVEE